MESFGIASISVLSLLSYIVKCFLTFQVANFNTLIGRTDAIMSDFDLRMLSLETASYNGVLSPVRSQKVSISNLKSKDATEQISFNIFNTKLLTGFLRAHGYVHGHTFIP